LEVFKVNVESVEQYFNFDPQRTGELKRLDKLILDSAPSLKRFFHKGTPTGEIGMRFKMIGYGQTLHRVKSGQSTTWPVIGVALQKNYISVYFAVNSGNLPVVDSYIGRLGELKCGQNNFSFRNFNDLDEESLSLLFAESYFRSWPRADKLLSSCEV
jgi:hypothetical protein